MRVKRLLKTVQLPFGATSVWLGADSIVLGVGESQEPIAYVLVVSVPERASPIYRLVWMVEAGDEILPVAQDAQYVGFSEQGEAIFIETQEQALLRQAASKK